MKNNTISKSNCQYEKSKKALLRKLGEKKVYNNKVVDFLENYPDKVRAERIRECGTYIDIVNVDNVAKIINANFCRERLCNVCAWRKQKKFVATVTPVLEHLETQGYKYIFVTLTMRNPSAESLKDSLDELLKGYNKFLGRKRIETAFCGAIRSLEITYKEKADTYHPHIHLLVAVEEDYFSTRGKYLSQRQLCNIWQECIGSEYVPVCYVEKVYNTLGSELETLKYATKPSEDLRTLKVFYEVLKGRRLISFSGVFAKCRKEFDKALKSNADIGIPSGQYTSLCYRFDVTGGVYTYYSKHYFEIEERKE